MTMYTPENVHATQPPQDPKTIKKMEKQIIKEGEKEEKQLKQAIKDLNRTEKAQHKAEKALHKAENALQKNEKKEQATLHDLRKATHKHDAAITSLHSAEQDTQIQYKEQLKLQAAVDAKKAQVDSVLKTHEAHQQEREIKVEELENERAAASYVPQAADTSGGRVL